MTTAPVEPAQAHTDQTRPGYKLTPLGWIPTEWKVVKLGDVGRVGTGSTPNTGVKNFWYNEISLGFQPEK